MLSKQIYFFKTSSEVSTTTQQSLKIESIPAIVNVNTAFQILRPEAFGHEEFEKRRSHISLRLCFCWLKMCILNQWLNQILKI